MLVIGFSLVIILLSVAGIVRNKNNFLFFVLYVEIILICITFIFSISYYTQGSYFGQIYGLFILTIAAIESAIIVSLIVQFYRYRGTISINIINYKSR